ncbi:hypothetical protein YC2023_116503 [Brassica napus]
MDGANVSTFLKNNVEHKEDLLIGYKDDGRTGRSYQMNKKHHMKRFILFLYICLHRQLFKNLRVMNWGILTGGKEEQEDIYGSNGGIYKRMKGP